ncbi:DUF433 domain-containing protein [candidate division KSB1 bacterium]|nr:DUF433 domain-containing protein [candidate division KSB1 bacterium]
MENQYVEKRDDCFWISGTRVSLDSVVFAFLDGLAPETIVAECFPVLTLEQVYGAITYYLSHRVEINVYLKNAESEFKTLHKNTNETAFSKKMGEARRQIQISQE